MAKLLRLLPLFILLALVACQPEAEKKPSQYSKDEVLGKWRYEKVYNSHGRILKSVSYKDTLALLENGEFYYYLRFENIYATGNWQLADSSIVFTYDIIPSGLGMKEQFTNNDSITFILNDKGNTQFKLASKVSTNKETVRTYELDFPENKMIFKEKNVRFSFKR